MNSQQTYGNNSIAYGLDINNQNDSLDKMDIFIKSMLVRGKKSLMLFQKGILISNMSLKHLLNDLIIYYDLQRIITRRLNQDILENFFSFIRGMGGANDHPSPMDFKYR